MKLEIIPAIDIIEGKCVRLVKGDYSKKTIYNDSPLEVAKQFESAGIKKLHLVDLDGAKSQGIENTKVLEEIALKTKLTIDFGGGIKSDKDIETAFNCGAYRVNIGSIAVKDKPLFLRWFGKYGADKILLSADTKNNKIAIQGWLEESDEDVIKFIDSYYRLGLVNVVCTDINKDGMLSGTSVSLYEKIIKKNPNINLTASGGFSSEKEFNLLENIGVTGLIIGKAIYENKISLKQISKYIK